MLQNLKGQIQMGRNSCYNSEKRNMVRSIKNKNTQILLWLLVHFGLNSWVHGDLLGKVSGREPCMFWEACICRGNPWQFYLGSGMIR